MLFSSLAERVKNSYLLFIVFITANTLKYTIFSLWLADAKADWYIGKFFFVLAFLYLVWLLVFRFLPRYAWTVLYVLQGLFIFAHISYYSYFHEVLNILFQVRNILEAIALVPGLAIPLDSALFILIIDVPFFILMLRNFKRGSLHKKFIMISGGCMLLLFAVIQYVFYVDEPFTRKDKFMPIDEKDIVVCYGFTAHNIYYFLKTGSEKEMIDRIRYGTARKYTAEEQYNFILIQCESLQSGILEVKYKGKLVMPELNRLSRQAVYYPFLFSYHMAGHSSDCEIAVMDNFEPFARFPTITLKSLTHSNSFVRIMREQGYATKTFHNNHARYYGRKTVYPKMGFSRFYDYKDMGYTSYDWGLPDGPMYDFMLDQMKKERGKFFYYCITMTTHGPFTSWRKYSDTKAYEDITHKYTYNYFNSFAYVDRELSRFIKSALAERKDTVIFVFGDHAAIASKYIPGPIFYHEGQKLEFVPLLVFGPDEYLKRLKKYESALSFHDIGPTILDGAGYTGVYVSIGESLFRDYRAGKVPFRGMQLMRDMLYREVSKEIK
ncbi:LTA synthase family protein [Spirochaetota bacterium]